MTHFSVRAGCVVCAAIMFAMVANSDAADERFVVLNGLSYHSDRAAPFNERNFGVGFASKRGNCGTEAGYYRNSYDAGSFYANGFCEIGQDMHAGVWGGGATGYDFAGNALGLTGFVGIHFRAGPVTLKLSNAGGLVLFMQVWVPVD